MMTNYTTFGEAATAYIASHGQNDPPVAMKVMNRTYLTCGPDTDATGLVTVETAHGIRFTVRRDLAAQLRLLAADGLM